MAKLTDEEIALFPLRNIDSVVKLFKTHLERNGEPNLAILSIILGYIENTLTCSRGPDPGDPETNDEQNNSDWADSNITKVPTVEYSFVEALYQRFLSIIKAHVDVVSFGTPKYASRELVKRVSDVVWCTLSSSYYKDRAHLQSIYSYMSGGFNNGKVNVAGHRLNIFYEFISLFFQIYNILYIKSKCSLIYSYYSY